MMVPSSAASLEIPTGIGSLGSQPSNQPDFWCNNFPDTMIKFFGMQCSTIAPPRAPTGSVLTVPPADEAQAQAVVDTLINQQLKDQQALNAQNVKSSEWDQWLGDTYKASTDYMPYILMGSAIALLVWLKK